MSSFNPYAPVSIDNYAIEIEWSYDGESLIRHSHFGDVLSAFEFIDGFDYETADILGRQGDPEFMAQLRELLESADDGESDFDVADTLRDEIESDLMWEYDS